MAEIALLASNVITIFIEGVKALKLASSNLDDAPLNLRKLERLVGQLDSSLLRAELKHSSKLHNGEFRSQFDELRELVQGFKAQVGDAKKLATPRNGLNRFFTCCWSAVVGDELLQMAFSMETQLHAWTQNQKVSQSIDEALEMYTQGLPSFLSLQPEDGYQPLVEKVASVCELLQKGSNKIVLVHGLSGIGKSSLAHYVAANCLPERFVDGSTRILLGYGCSRRAVGNNTVAYQKVFAEKMVHFLRGQLGYKRHEIDGISLNEAFLLLEETLRGKRYLIIVDDVWETDVVMRFLKIQGNSCKYLVTSRLSGIISSEVDRVELTKEDVTPVGKQILQHHSQISSLPEVADILLERCGFHPLTITVIGQALEGEVRDEQWNQAINELCVYASSASIPSTNLVEDDFSSAATVFGSLEFSLNAMEKNYRDLFTTFASISWVEPIPEACLEELWRALQLEGTFKLAIGALLRGSLIGKHKSSYSYMIHDMVALYLAGKQPESMKLLLDSPGARESEAVSPWLYRYGKECCKEESSRMILQSLRRSEEASLFRVFDSAISVCSACRNFDDRTNTKRDFVDLFAPEIPKLLPGIPVGGRSSQSIIRFITNFYTPRDWEYHLSSFMDCDILLHLHPLLKLRDESLNSMVDVVEKLATFASTLENSQNLVENMPVHELVHLLDPGSKTTRNYVGSSAMKALIAIAKAGGELGVERMFMAGLGEMILEQIKSDFEEFSGSGMRELNLLRERYLEGGSLILDTFLASGLLTELPDDSYRDYFHGVLI